MDTLQHNMHCCIYCHQTKLQAHLGHWSQIWGSSASRETLCMIFRRFAQSTARPCRAGAPCACNMHAQRHRVSTVPCIVLLPLLLLPLLLQSHTVTCAQLPV